MTSRSIDHSEVSDMKELKNAAANYMKSAAESDKNGLYENALSLYIKAFDTFEKMTDPKGIIDALLGIQSASKNLGKWVEMKRYYKRAVEVCRNIGDKDTLARALELYAEFGMNSMDYKEAVTASEEACRILYDLGKLDRLVTAVNITSQLYYSLGEPDKAKSFCKWVTEIIENIGNEIFEAEVRRMIGGIYEYLYDLDAALLEYQKAFRIYRKHDLYDGFFRSASLIARIFSKKGKFEKAIDIQESVLNWLRELPQRDYKLEAAIESNLGRIYFNSVFDLEKAIEHYQKAYDLFEKVGDKSSMAKSLYYVGRSHLLLFLNGGEDFEKAINIVNRALDLYKEANDQSGIVDTLLGLGEMYRSVGKRKEAMEYYNKVSRYLEGKDDKYTKALVLQAIGEIYAEEGNNEKALENFAVVSDILEKTKNYSMLLRTLATIGNIYADLEEYEKAISYYNRGLEISEKIGRKGSYGVFLQIIGSTYEKMEDYDKALDYYTSSYKVMTKTGDELEKGLTLVSIGRIEMRNENAESAKKYYTEAYEIFKKYRNAKYLVMAIVGLADAEYVLTEDIERFIELHQEALRLLYDVASWKGITYILSRMGEAYIDSERYNDAVETFSEMLRIATKYKLDDDIERAKSRIEEIKEMME